MILRASQKENEDTTIGFRIRTAVTIDSVTQDSASEAFTIEWHETEDYVGDSTTQTVRVRFRQVGVDDWTLLEQVTALEITYDGVDDDRIAQITVEIPEADKVACEEKIEFLVQRMGDFTEEEVLAEDGNVFISAWSAEGDDA